MSDPTANPGGAPPGLLARGLATLGQWTAWLFVIAMVMSGYEVLMRYVFDRPTTWVHVTATTLCAIGFSLGGAYCMVRGEHIRITSVTQHFGLPLRRACELLGIACGLIYLGGLSYAAVLQAWEAVWRFEGPHWRPEPVPGPPHWPLPALMRVALAVGALLFLLALLRHLVRVLRRQALER